MKEVNVEMNKKYFSLIIVSLLLFSVLLNVVQAADDLFSEDNIVNLEAKWEYLGKEWKNVILGNPIMKAIDSFFTSISIVFLIIFGIDYSLSFTFLFTVILWIFFVAFINNIFRIVSIFSEKICLVIAVAMVIGAGQLEMLKWPVDFLMGWLFGEKEVWMKWVIGIGTFLALSVIYMFLKTFAKQAKKNREELKIEKDKLDLHAGAEVGKVISKAAADVAKGKISILDK